jgi:hypothetical protein
MSNKTLSQLSDICKQAFDILWRTKPAYKAFTPVAGAPGLSPTGVKEEGTHDRATAL